MEKIKDKVKCLSLSRLEEGSIGFMRAEKEGVWYNVLGEPEVLKELIKNVVAKGNIIEFEFNNGVVGDLKLIEKAPEKEGFDMTNFEDLLTSAHEKFKGKLNIETEMLSVDYEKKQALFKATVTIFEDIFERVKVGEVETEELKGSSKLVFTGHGDAQGIDNKNIQPHFIRMAETRAIVRALRWATNNAAVAVEETEEAPDPK